MTRIIFNKKHLHLCEDNNNSNGSAFVEPSDSNTSSLASDLNKSKQNNPTDDTFIFNANDYNGKKSDNTITIDIDAKNPTDAQRKFQQMQQNPQVKNMVNNSNVKARVRLQNENVVKLKENCVTFSKKELNEMLK